MNRLALLCLIATLTTWLVSGLSLLWLGNWIGLACFVAVTLAVFLR